MRHVVDWARYIALTFGAPGLFLVAFLDASFLSLPEINDFLLVWMVTRHKHRLVLYVMSSTLGSIAGCLLLYYLGRKGGEAIVARRFGGPNVERALAAFRRYGLMAVLIPSILPPPAPFKIFVLLAGVAGVGAARFTVAIAVGRGARYFAEGLLALRYGDRTIGFLRDHSLTASLAAVGLLVAGVVVYVVWSKVGARSRR
jgi:membrane protein YqaA with SNARE-associated domain